MITRVRIRIEEPDIVKEQDHLRASPSCALCGFKFEEGAFVCRTYITLDPSDKEEALGEICLKCRDAEPGVIIKHLQIQAERQEFQAGLKYRQVTLSPGDSQDRLCSLKSLAEDYLLEAAISRQIATRLRELSRAEIERDKDLPEPVCIYL